MLKLPAFMHKQFPTGETVTVFQDDAQFWRFYLIPGFPTVRTDPNNNPVFQLIKYKFSDESREEHPQLPRGGGYMVFDSELKVKAEHQEAVEKELQQWVQSGVRAHQGAAEQRSAHADPGRHIQRLDRRSTGRRTSMAGGPMGSPQTSQSTTLTMPGTGLSTGARQACRTSSIGEPLWKSGKVTMNAPSSAGLVQNKIGERPASLLGNNVAAFSLDLTPDGAAFMEQTLVGRDGHGATDLTPIQVVYELTMAPSFRRRRCTSSSTLQSLYHTCRSSSTSTTTARTTTSLPRT